MFSRRIAIAATFLILLPGTGKKAVAGCCPPAVPTCVCPVSAPQIYVVEQGPIFTGPGPCLRQATDPAPPAYPYVGHVYTGYPYGEFGPGGYPRGFYSPYLGYPYAEPYPVYPAASWRRHHRRHYSWRAPHARTLSR